MGKSVGNVEHLNVITTVDTIRETYAFDVNTLMADSAFATGTKHFRAGRAWHRISVAAFRGQV